MKWTKVKFYRLRRVWLTLAEIREQDVADMLRYDTAFWNALEPTLVAFPTFKTPLGNLGGKPTVGRWHSFGFVLEPVPSEPEMDSNAWVTFRNSDLTTARGGLRKVQLSDYLNKTLDQIRRDDRGGTF